MATNSIIDYLNSTKAPSDFASRTLLASKAGITNYTGTAAQNTQLLRTLQSGGTTSRPLSTVSLNQNTGPATVGGAPYSTLGPTGAPMTKTAPIYAPPAPATTRTLVSAAPAPGSQVLNQPAPAPTQQLPDTSNTGASAPVAPSGGNSTDLNATLLAMYKAAADNSNNQDLYARRNAIMEARFGNETTTTGDMQRLSPTQQNEIRSASDKGLGALLGGTDAAIKARNDKFQNDITIAEKMQTIIEKQKAAGKPIEVNPGNDLVDPTTGKVLYHAPEKVAHSAIFNEWTDYINSGGKLSFDAYQTMDANRKRSLSVTNNAAPGELPSDVQKVLQAISNNFNTNYKAPDSGLIESNAYHQAYADFAAKYPKYASKFTDYFPPQVLLQQSDPRNAGILGVKPSVTNISLFGHG